MNPPSPLIDRISNPLNLAIAVITLCSFAYGGYSWYYSRQYEYQLKDRWSFTFIIDSSSMESYVNMTAGYTIFLDQKNLDITGKGEKILINGKNIPSAQHDRIEFQGQQKEDSVFITYLLYGQKRTSDGLVKLVIKDPNHMEGIFLGNAANTKGRVAAIRI